MKKISLILLVVLLSIAGLFIGCELQIEDPYVPTVDSSVEAVAAEGLTISFTFNNTSSDGVDWSTHIIKTNNNYIITLPNLDPWNNTATGSIISAKNAFPTAAGATLESGYAWNSAYTGSDVAVKLTLKNDGIKFYLDGSLYLTYGLETFGVEGGMEEFINAFVSAYINNTYTLNPNGLDTIKNISIVKGVN